MLEKNTKWAPFFGSIFGIIPECGVSVVAADLFNKHHLTVGTIIAIFLSCSDEALPILFANWSSNWYLTFILIGLKIAIGVLVGMLVDLLLFKRQKKVEEHLEHCEGTPSIHTGCCGHEIEGEKASPWKEHLLHPIIHSLKIWAYCFIVAFAFGTLVYFVGEENIASWLTSQHYLTPLYASIIGLIPNCVSSVLLSDLFLQGALPFGALLSGLLVNAGLGMLMIFKNKNWKNGLLVLSTCLAVSLASGYITLLIMR